VRRWLVGYLICTRSTTYFDIHTYSTYVSFFLYYGEYDENNKTLKLQKEGRDTNTNRTTHIHKDTQQTDTQGGKSMGRKETQIMPLTSRTESLPRPSGA